MKLGGCTVWAVALLALSVNGDAGPLLGLNKCDASNPNQIFARGTADEIILNSTGACVDVPSYATAPGSALYTFSPCHPGDKDPAHQNEAWLVNSNKTITERSTGLCIAPAFDAASVGQTVMINTCTGSTAQKWIFTSEGLLQNGADTSLCIDAAPPRPRPCDELPAKNFPFCNASLDLDTRIRDVISRLSIQDKVALTANTAGAAADAGLPAYQWWSEALHGVGFSPGVTFMGKVQAATSFPQVIHTSASFNKTLWHHIGMTISTEARAMNNVNQAGLTFWAPNINIIRDPRWGRGQETPGEDPYATGLYAANFVPGMQEGEDTRYIKASSCCKHFFDYNLEDWHNVDRHHFNAIATDQDIADTYLPAFESCVRFGRASSLMCSYNAVNGVPSCANADIMTTLAREAWGFDGYITSDCGAVEDVYSNHKYYNTTGATVNGVLSAGMDVDCGSFLSQHLADAIDSGDVTNATVDQALYNLFRVQFRLGMFDPAEDQPYLNLTTDAVNTPEHQQLALEAARQGMTLLENRDSRLPLDASSIKQLALIGPNANATGVMQGNYNGKAPFLISPQQGVQQYVSNVALELGCDVGCASDGGFASAVTAAKAADTVVMVIGLDQTQESEGHDREIIALPGMQAELVAQVANASSSPIVVVVMTGGAVDLTPVKDLDNVGAILWCGYPGQAGGQALAETLFGDNNPGGRLPYTLYPADLVNQVSMFDDGMRPNATSGNPGRTYRFYTGTPVYAYGTGLSYTSFSYETSTPSLRVSAERVRAWVAARGQTSFIRDEVDAEDYITVTVQNNGTVAGADVVQVFIKTTTPGADGNPIKSLCGFERVFLKPGETTSIQFPVTPHDLSVVNSRGERVAVPGTWTVEVHHEARLSIPISVE